MPEVLECAVDFVHNWPMCLGCACQASLAVTLQTQGRTDNDSARFPYTAYVITRRREWRHTRLTPSHPDVNGMALRRCNTRSLRTMADNALLRAHLERKGDCNRHHSPQQIRGGFVLQVCFFEPAEIYVWKQPKQLLTSRRRQRQAKGWKPKAHRLAWDKCCAILHRCLS